MCEKAFFFWLEQTREVEIRRLDQRGTEEPDHAGLVGHGNDSSPVFLILPT